MSDVLVEYQRAGEALANPALQLVTHKWAPIVLAVLGTSFGQTQRSVATDRLHIRLETHLAELRELGHPTPDQDARSLCRDWVSRQWLRRLDEDDGPVYELTSHVFMAQRIVEGLGQQTAMLSESRLTMILDAVRRASIDADPDRGSRITALQEQIDRLVRERDELAEGGAVPVVSNERMLMQYRDIIDLLAQLPGDFRRVEESIAAMRQQMVQSFREDRRPRGEVLGEYLAASEKLLLQTEEGRAFVTALEMLRDEALLESFREDARRILAHPFAGPERMSARDRRVLLDADNLLRSGLYSVQSQQHRATRSLTEYLESHDSAGERELSEVLSELDRALGAWMVDARPRDWVPMAWLPAQLDVHHLPNQFHAPEFDRAPEPMTPLAEMDVPDGLSLRELRRGGGPLTDELVVRLRALADDGRADDLVAAFALLPDELRRPVELWGLAQWALDEGLLDASRLELGVATTVRPDGSTRELVFPHVQLSREEQAHE